MSLEKPGCLQNLVELFRIISIPVLGTAVILAGLAAVGVFPGKNTSGPAEPESSPTSTSSFPDAEHSTDMYGNPIGPPQSKGCCIPGLGLVVFTLGGPEVLAHLAKALNKKI